MQESEVRQIVCSERKDTVAWANKKRGANKKSAVLVIHTDLRTNTNTLVQAHTLLSHYFSAFFWMCRDV